VKFVLNRGGAHREQNMQQLYMYIREHYEPTHCRPGGELEEMEKRLEEWRQHTVTAEENYMAAFQLEAIAARMTSTAATATAEAARATAEAAWMTSEAARITSEAARMATCLSSDDTARLEPQPKKKAKI